MKPLTTYEREIVADIFKKAKAILRKADVHFDLQIGPPISSMSAERCKTST